MSVPDFQSWFSPLLERLSDGEIHKMADLYEELADDFNLSEEDRSEYLPSGKQLKYKNRIGWARTYLKKAGLLESPDRGECRITQRGLDVLKNPPEKINVNFLKKYPEFVEFHTYTPPATGKGQGPEADDDQTPEEKLEEAYEALRDACTKELLDRIKNAPPGFFESLVVDLLLRMGYGGSRRDAGKTLGKSGDGGVDGVINEDRLGLDVVYVQAKRWENVVGRPVVQAFAGSLEGVRARKGVMLTTSDFSSGARKYVSRIEKRIVLIDGKQLAELMYEHNLGVSIGANYEVKEIDGDFFEET